MTRPELHATKTEDVFAGYARLLRQRESLREVIESISSELEFRPLLTRIVRHACELLDAYDGSIGLYDEDNDLIHTEAIYRMPESELGAHIRRGVGLAGRVLETRAPVVLQRYDMLPVITLPELAEHAVIGLPIMWHEDLIGFFGVGAKPPRRFDEGDVEILALFARHAAIAIQNARQYERETARSQRLALIARIGGRITAKLDLDELLQSAADLLHELGYFHVAIGLISPSDSSMVVIRTVAGHVRPPPGAEHRFSITQGIMGAAARERRAQLVNDVRADPRYLPTPVAKDIRAELAVPILLAGEVLGILNVETRGRLGEEDATGLQIIADHLAVAIENTRLFEDTRRLAALEERQRLARDLHDSITQMLFSASLMSQSISEAWRRDAGEGTRITQRVVELTRGALVEMRALLRELRPAGSDEKAPAEGDVLPTLERLRRYGLPETMRRDAAGYSAARLLFELDLGGYRVQAPATEEVLYRVFQEALHNVMKHAGGSWVRVRLSCADGRVLLVIQDGGVGFEPNESASGAGLGLRGMRERVASAGGELRIRSAPGEGTSVEASLPASGS